MPAPQKPKAPNRGRPRKSHGAIYWLVFLICTVASFGGGFWYTYRSTSDVQVRAPQNYEPPSQASPAPAAMADASASTAAAPGTVNPFANGATSVAQPVAAGQGDQQASLASPAPDTASNLAGGAPQDAGAPPQAAPSPDQVGGQQVAADAGMQAATPVTLYRVQVGSYDSRESAQSMVDELAAAGIQATVVTDGDTFHAQVGAFASRDDALALAQQVNAKGYAVTIRR